MDTKTVLIVDDEAAIRDMLRVALEMANFHCIEAKNAYEAQVSIVDDLVLLDWMMPEVSGIELLRRWRRNPETKKIPVIMLTAKAEEESLVKGLDAGADDYISKPFSPRELVARIKTIFRRVASEISEGPISIDELTMDPSARSVTITGKTVNLGPTEYRLLEFFLMHQNRAFTREQLLNNVWGNNVYIDERTIDVHIRRLRKALEPYGYENYVQTVRGFGYRMASPE
jgi:two-component system phosphate regulon response regulator PhoB